MIWPLLRTPRWQGFTALVVFVIIAFGLLSAWQWSRAEDRRTERNVLQAALAVEPLPLDIALTRQFTQQAWIPVQFSGTYQPEAQVLVRKKPLEARNGFWVLTPVNADSPLDAAGRTVWVNRGWIPVQGSALSTPDIPPPPEGTVDISGYLLPYWDSAPDRNEGLPAGQVADPALSLLPDVGATELGLVQLSDSQPAQSDVRPLPLPDIDETRNVSYAFQWLIFAAIAMGGWYFFLRREAREDDLRTAKRDDLEEITILDDQQRI